jgi:opacity protein-like surface antigen
MSGRFYLPVAQLYSAVACLTRIRKEQLWYHLVVGNGRLTGETLMKTILAAALLGVAFIAPAQAQTVHEGTYKIEGTNLDGSSYGGTAEIKLTSETTCAIRWKTGSGKKGTSNGICMLYENAFAAGYVLEGEIGLIVYEVKDDGTLEGAWTISGQDGSGTETLTPQ